MSADSSSPPPYDQAHCRCGHNRHHKNVVAQMDYSLWGTFAQIILGASVIPKRARYRCVECGETFLEITDPEVLKREARSY